MCRLGLRLSFLIQSLVAVAQKAVFSMSEGSNVSVTGKEKNKTHSVNPMNTQMIKSTTGWPAEALKIQLCCCAVNKEQLQPHG